MNSVIRKAGSGFAWSLLSQLIKLGSQLVGMILLSRLLPASDFGLISMASVVTGFALLLRDFGATATVIHRQELTPQILDSVYLFNIVISLFLAIVLALLNPLVVWFFSEPRLREVLWLLILAFPVGALGLVHQGLLERASNFKHIAFIESFAALLGLASAVGGALLGWGVYSLVTQTLVSAFITTTCFWVSSPWHFGNKATLTDIKGLRNFAGNLVGFNVFNYFARNTDNLLIGHFLGATELGIYAMAYRLMTLPLQIISGVLGRSLFPVLSKMQDDPDRLADAYRRALAAVTLVNAPLLMGFFALRESFVTVVMGVKWMPVADLLMWLLPVALLQSVGTTVGYLYLAMGRTDVMLKWGIFAGILFTVGFYVGLHWRLQGVVAVYAVANAILFVPSLFIPFQFVRLKVSRVLINLLPSILNALVMASFVAAINKLWTGFMDDPIIRLILLVILAVLNFGTLAYTFQRDLLKDIIRVFSYRKINGALVE
jgi:O-antigen/teichoic acid export membrane protein